MTADTKIQWARHTFNAWIGCFKISDGCKNCYAAVDTFARRSRANGTELWGKDAERHVTSDAYWKQLKTWNRKARAAGERHRVFCSSLSDIAERPDRPDVLTKLDAARARLWALIEECESLDFLLLTKRPENFKLVLPKTWLEKPRPNVWLMTTAENQEQADKRLPDLLSVPAVVHGVSAEPLLGLIRFDALNGETCDHCGETVLYNAFTADARCACCVEGAEPVAWYHLTWIIPGGESGPHARAAEVAWSRAIVEQAAYHECAVFQKQLGANVVDHNDANFEGEGGVENREGLAPWPEGIETEDFWNDPTKQHQGALVRIRLKDKKGGEPGEWPPDLRVRQLPTPAVSP